MGIGCVLMILSSKLPMNPDGFRNWKSPARGEDDVSVGRPQYSPYRPDGQETRLELVTIQYNGGSEVDPQLVKSAPLTSTQNTTLKSSYWASSLVKKYKKFFTKANAGKKVTVK